MSVTSQEYMNVSADIVGGLIETVSLAEFTSFPAMVGDADDISLVLDALRVLRPKLREIDTFESTLYMARGQWDDAIRVLSGLIEAVPHFAYAKGLMAFCLAFKGDSNWRQSAAEAIDADSGPMMRQLVRSLEAHEDLRAAMHDYQRTGQFNVPQSCVDYMRELKGDDGDVPSAPEKAAEQLGARQADAEQPGYLRV